MGHREFLTLAEHARSEWNCPDRHDHYMIQLTDVVYRMLNEKSHDFKIKFEYYTPELDLRTDEEKRRDAAEIAKATLFAIGGKPAKE